jgi:hypothetical protein
VQENGISFLLDDKKFIGLNKENFSELNKTISRQSDSAVNMERLKLRLIPNCLNNWEMKKINLISHS